jgi:hypothetical protein
MEWRINDDDDDEPVELQNICSGLHFQWHPFSVCLHSTGYPYSLVDKGGLHGCVLVQCRPWTQSISLCIQCFNLFFRWYEYSKLQLLGNSNEFQEKHNGSAILCVRSGYNNFLFRFLSLLRHWGSSVLSGLCHPFPLLPCCLVKGFVALSGICRTLCFIYACY